MNHLPKQKKFTVNYLPKKKKKVLCQLLTKEKKESFMWCLEWVESHRKYNIIERNILYSIATSMTCLITSKNILKY